MRYFSIVIFSFLFTISILAQDTCSSFVNDALATVDTRCEETGRNELCYGNNIVSVTTFTGEELDFSQPGDITSILDIETIRTNPYAVPDEWGIALMRIQANIPDTLPGQNVTFLLFGDTNLRNAGSNSTALSASTTVDLNTRSGPSTNHSITGSLRIGTDITLIGRNSAADWVYFTTEGSSDWLFASLLQIEGDVMTLEEVPDNFVGSSVPRPMQAVYFSSGIGESTCNDVPQDGILIQTPDYEQPIELIVNEVEITLGSTVYLQVNEDFMSVTVLDGFAILEAFEGTQIILSGTVSQIPLGSDGLASGPPQSPQPYDTESLQLLPMDSGVLEEEIEIVPVMSAEEMQAAQTPIKSGNYSVNWTTITACEHSNPDLLPTTWVTVYNADGSVTTFGRTWLPVGGSSYEYAELGTPYWETGVITFTSATSFVGSFRSGNLGVSDDCIDSIMGVWSSP